MKIAEYIEKNRAELPAELAELLMTETRIWTNDACYGYCIRALELAGFDCETIDRVRRCLHDAFDELSVEDAEQKWWKW